ncbi:MAG: NAD-dependent epimerase/dehydratase family protein [Bacteroidales bacterium]|nr:NAD-dependent epimerase/dehydratase family protein [Bacteroidales bacterium]
MKILVTGSAGFIGFHTALKFISSGHEVVGLDNLNHYYDIRLKYARVAECGFSQEQAESGVMERSSLYPTFRFIKIDISDREAVERLFRDEKFDIVCNLAAQAGVRYSLENPFSYVKSNIEGFLSILEACRKYPVKHLIYASSSSVYGMNEKVPFREADKTDSPVSLYAATKKSNELMAHSYSSLYGIPATGLRFFTVYGPWGRPDMAPMLFIKAAVDGRGIRVFNNGNLLRDFTYIDDIVEGIAAVAKSIPPVGGSSDSTKAPHAIYNIGNSAPIALLDFIAALERVTGKEIEKEFTDMQPGDVYQTYADTTSLEETFGYRPSTSLDNGIAKLYEWYISHPSIF